MRTLVLANLAVTLGLALAAAPAGAQQFSFVTGDRSMQGYGSAPRAYSSSNDGSQGGGLATGPATTSPYQASFAPGQSDQSGGGGPSNNGTGGGTGATSRTVGGSGGTNMALYNPANRDVQPTTLVSVPGTAGGPGSGGGAGGSTATASGGKNSTVIGNIPQGLNLGGGCPPACGPTAGGKGLAATPGDTMSVASTVAGSGVSAAQSGTYTFKFTGPVTPTVTPTPTPTPGPAPIANIANIQNTTTAGGKFAGTSVNPQLKSLQSVPNLQSLSAIKQKN